MTTNLTTTSASRTVFDVMSQMVAEDVGRIAVSQNDIPVGIFTEKDVLRRVINKIDSKKTAIRDVMTSPIRAVREETHIVEAFGKMYKGRYRHLLVRGRRGKIVGIVSMRRILGLAAELGQHLSESKTLGEIMSSGVATVDESLSVAETIERMVQQGLGGIVVTVAGRPAGMFTERDVLKRVAVPEVDLRNTPVRSVMSSPLITMTHAHKVSDVLSEMYRRDIRNIPVTGESQQLIGVLSMADILQYAQALNIDERVRQTWKEVQEHYDSEDQYTPG
jgi:CBS domain-containing protein